MVATPIHKVTIHCNDVGMHWSLKRKIPWFKKLCKLRIGMELILCARACVCAYFSGEFVRSNEDPLVMHHTEKVLVRL